MTWTGKGGEVYGGTLRDYSQSEDSSKIPWGCRSTAKPNGGFLYKPPRLANPLSGQLSDGKFFWKSNRH
jgi:hypothetical protein